MWQTKKLATYEIQAVLVLVVLKDIEETSGEWVQRVDVGQRPKVDWLDVTRFALYTGRERGWVFAAGR